MSFMDLVTFDKQREGRRVPTDALRQSVVADSGSLDLDLDLAVQWTRA